MTTNSGIKGKTVEQLRRSTEAAARQALRDTATTNEHLASLGARPGLSAREIVRLFAGDK